MQRPANQLGHQTKTRVRRQCFQLSPALHKAYRGSAASSLCIVAYGSLADKPSGTEIHRCPLWSKSGQTRVRLDCPLSAKSGQTQARLERPLSANGDRFSRLLQWDGQL